MWLKHHELGSVSHPRAGCNLKAELNFLLYRSLTLTSQHYLGFLYGWKGCSRWKIKNMYTLYNIQIYTRMYFLHLLDKLPCSRSEFGFTFLQVGEILVDGTRLSDWETWISWIWCCNRNLLWNFIHICFFNTDFTHTHTKWGIIQYTTKFVLFGSGKTVILFFIMLHHHSLLKMELCNTLPITSIEPYPVCKWRNTCVFHETPNTK